MSPFTKALSITLQYEGGYVNHPNDRGGATNKGVTQRTYDAYRTRERLSLQSVKLISGKELETIYYTEYWVRAKCHELTEKLSIVHFDSAVNHGVGNAGKLLQKALGFAKEDRDGVIGPKTLAALQGKSDAVLANQYLACRAEFFQKIAQNNPSQKTFLNGWMNRIAKLKKEIA